MLTLDHCIARPLEHASYLTSTCVLHPSEDQRQYYPQQDNPLCHGNLGLLRSQLNYLELKLLVQTAQSQALNAQGPRPRVAVQNSTHPPHP